MKSTFSDNASTHIRPNIHTKQPTQIKSRSVKPNPPTKYTILETIGA